MHVQLVAIHDFPANSTSRVTSLVPIYFAYHIPMPRDTAYCAFTFLYGFSGRFALHAWSHRLNVQLFPTSDLFSMVIRVLN